MNLDLEKFYKYLNLSNADLTCELVKEFPSLQGKVGGYYASQENLPEEVYEAFFSQYNLDFPKSDNYLSLLMSISQKVDGILGFFISNEKLSGAGDPFGIRRSALSIIKICIDNSLNLDLIEIFEFLKKKFVEQNISPKVNLEDVIDYFRKRILILFADMGYKNEEVQSVLSKNKFNPLQLFNDLKVLKKFIISDNGKDFLKAIKRLISINENSKVQPNIDVNIFQSKEEVNLYKCSQYLIRFDQGIDFLEDKKFIILFTKSLNQFFDKVKVNSDDEKLKENRKALISFLYEKVNDIYKFETIIK
jgi:glycyl-tRNA synthetase beta chain